MKMHGFIKEKLHYYIASHLPKKKYSIHIGKFHEVFWMEMQGFVPDKTASHIFLNFLIWLIKYSGEVRKGFYIECFWMEMKGFVLEKVIYIASHYF